MKGEAERGRHWFPGALALGLVAVGAYGGCMPDFEKLSSEYSPDGSGAAPGSGGTDNRGGDGAGGNGGSGAEPGSGGTDFAGGAGMEAGGDGGTGIVTGGTGGAGGKGGTGATGGRGGRGGTGNGGAGGSGTGGDAGAGAQGGTSGGTGGTGGDGGEAGALTCEPPLVACPGASSCSDVDVGNPTGNTVADCGSCGTTCPVKGASSASCSSGTCMPACLGGFADCNAATDNDACEIYLDSLDACATDCTNGVACEIAQVCNAGACGAPQGMAVFTVPFTEAGQWQRYAEKFTPMPNLTNTDLYLRMYAPGATGGSMTLYLTDVDFTGGPGISVTLADLATGWTDVRVPIAGVSGAFDPSVAYQVTIEVQAGTNGPWTNPTVIYVDKVWSSNLVVNDTFNTSIGGMVSSSLQVVPGSTLTFADTMP